MGKRSSTSNSAATDEKSDALHSSKRRALQFASSSAVMTLLALRRELPRASSKETFYLDEQLSPLQPQRQVISVKYSVSSITDDEDEDKNETNKVVATKHVPPSLVQLALRKPIVNSAGSRRREFARLLPPAPFKRPLPPAPLLPSLLMPRGVIPSTKKSYNIYPTDHLYRY